MDIYQGLASNALATDPRVAQAKKLLLDAMADHQKTLTAIKPGDPHLEIHYHHILEHFASIRGAKTWYPYLGSGLGNGCFVELADGSVKYDFITGIGTHYFGHNHPQIVNSAIDAALTDIVMQGNLQQNVDSYHLSKLLVEQSKLDHCFLTTSGAMANENAIKVMLQKRFPANRFLAFERCFMGRTWTFSQITDRPSYREGLPTHILVDYVPYFDPLKPEESTAHAVKVVKRQLKRYPKEYAGMFFELIQGDGGFYAGSKEFFHAIMTVCKDHGLAIHIDEVQTFGRTPSLFAFHHFELDEFADIVTIGKLAQVCATLFTKEYNPKAGLLAQTFTAGTSAIRTGTVIIENLINGGFFGPQGKIQATSDYIIGKLIDLSKRYPDLIEGPFGLGMMVAFTPFKGDYKKVSQFVNDLFDAGVIAFITGQEPTRTRFLVPAGVVTFKDIDNVMKIVEEVLTKGSV